MRAEKFDIPALTGLRGIAALFVIATHYFSWCTPFKPDTAPRWMVEIFHTSDYGMTLFFTLSGFVITYNYLDFGWDQTPLRSFGRFAWLRFSRLYPALLVFILLMINPRPLAELMAPQFKKWIAIHVLSIESWAPFKFDGVLPINGTFNVIWSISTEFMLYFIFAITLIVGCWFHRRRQLKVFMALVAVAAASLLALAFLPSLRPHLYTHLWQPMQTLEGDEWDRWFFYLSPYFRITNFALGAAVAWLVTYRPKWIERHQPLISRAALVAGILFVGVVHFGLTILRLAPALVNEYLPVTELMTALLFAAVMLDSRSDTVVNRALSSRALVTIGSISYSLYLFHQFLPYLGTYHPGGAFSWVHMPRFAVNFSLSLLLSIVFAYGAWHIIEQPAQRLLRGFLTLRPAARSGALTTPAE